jgi:hypothetical protein
MLSAFTSVQAPNSNPGKLSACFYRNLRKYYKQCIWFCILSLGCLNYNNAQSAASPAWSRGEQLLAISFDESMLRANAALKAEGYVNIFRQANFTVGYKDPNTAIIMCNDAPDAKQWINIVVASNTHESGIPGAERERLQAQMNKPVTGSSNAGLIDWNKTAEEFRGKNYQRFTFTCPVNDYPGHRLYGTDVYTDDGSICAAGLHAGVINLSGGTVTIEVRPGQDSYTSSTRNGVSSGAWGAWPGSFIVVK